MKWKREKRTIGREESVRYVSPDGRIVIQKFKTTRRGRKPYQPAPQFGTITEWWYRVVIDERGVRDLDKIYRLKDAKALAEERYCPACKEPTYTPGKRKHKDRERDQWYWSTACPCGHEDRAYVVGTPCPSRRCRFVTESLEGDPLPKRCERCYTDLDVEAA